MGIRSKLEVAVAGYYLVCYVLAVVGLWANRRRAATWLVVLVLAGMTAAHSIGWACPRYRFPFEPVLLIVAGAGLAAWLGRWRSSATPAAGAGESAGGQ